MKNAARGTSASTSTSAQASATASPDIGAGAGAEAGAGLEKHPGLGVSLFCAGDEDQHIYGWRGTTVDHLHRHARYFNQYIPPLRVAARGVLLWKVGVQDTYVRLSALSPSPVSMELLVLLALFLGGAWLPRCVWDRHPSPAQPVTRPPLALLLSSRRLSYPILHTGLRRIFRGPFGAP